LEAEAAVIVPKLVDSLRRLAKGSIITDHRRAVAEALGLLGPKAKAAAPHLRKLLDDDDDEVVAAARQALERISKE
jgi:HEAT repeat protein